MKTLIYTDENIQIKNQENLRIHPVFGLCTKSLQVFLCLSVKQCGGGGKGGQPEVKVD